MPSKTEDLSSIQADVASFVSSLGFSAASGEGDGFYDADFRKKGRISDNKPPKTPKTFTTDKPWSSSELMEAKKKAKASSTALEASAKPEKAGSKQTSRIGLTAKQKHGEKEANGERKEEVAKAGKLGDSKHPFSKKETREKARDGFMKKKGAEKRDSSFDNGLLKKRKADNAKINESVLKKKLKQDDRTHKDHTIKGDSTKGGSKSLSRIMSLLKSGPWYEASPASIKMVSRNAAVGGADQTDGDLAWSALAAKVQKKGEELMEKVAAEYEKSRGKDSDMRWLMMARKTGTTADKVAAFTVLLQDNAIANLRSLDSLLGMVTSKGGKRHAAMGIDALKELFVTSLLPDRKLKFLMQQPLDAQLQDTQEADGVLFLWYWEDCLKQRYEQFVVSLEEASKDNLPFLKEKALKTIYELLKSKPEQERRLLSALVNKLGDPERKIASNAGYYLSCLLTAHPNMKMVVVQEVDVFLFRPHLGLRSRYQAVVFLNQIVLSNRKDGPKLAQKLIDIYFSLFKVITTGESKSSHAKEKSRPKKQGKIKQGKEEDGGVVEIDSRLLSALLTGVNRAFPYVAAEDVDTLVEEHTPVLFRLVHSKSFNVGVQALMLLYQLLAKNNTVSDRLYRALYAVLLSPGLSKSSKMEMFLGLVFKAIKSDINSKRMAAFAKRLMQVALQGAPQFACGCLLLLSEVLKSRPTLWYAVTQAEDADEEIEHFTDFRDDDMTEDDMFETNTLTNSPSNPAGDNEEDFGRWQKEGNYNARHRDPSFCNADRACWWELTALASHAHPSVAAMAKTLLSGASILYTGDPLRDLAFSVFLDRFTEKKPKSRRKSETWHGSSLLAPSKKPSMPTAFPVRNDFLNLSEKEVAPEDVVFHKFYTSKVGRKQKSTKIAKSKDDDILVTGEDDLLGDESDDDEIEDLLDQGEGAEMGLDDLSEEEDESEGEWTYHQTDGPLNVANGEHMSSEEGDDFDSENELSLDEDTLDEDLKEHSFDDMDLNESAFEENMDQLEGPPFTVNDGVKRHANNDNKKERKRKDKITFKKESSAKSPFADIEKYSHLLENDTVRMETREGVFDRRKRK
ncbi:hypothetical protein GOP47_0021609 [Adiantum capillus-veneris]|uniref:CCAAT-binding factor domain-containing protein n=1 Tax=Adiantum capillus-veneris TaxID=13818 RepID=A0A9D4U847_ADICA|nr:hypothetical protein GOP47_0021609 [Adiantum capillus-veneris]